MFVDYGDELLDYHRNLARPDLLDSALQLTRQPYYTGVWEKSGALLRSMVKNHPFIDGNKRMGVAAAFTFLAINGRFLAVTNDEMVEYTVHLAESSPTPSFRSVGRWLRDRCVTPGQPPGPKADLEVFARMSALIAASAGSSGSPGEASPPGGASPTGPTAPSRID